MQGRHWQHPINWNRDGCSVEWSGRATYQWQGPAKLQSRGGRRTLMILWTHHPSSFKLDEPGIRVDPTNGKYWKMSESKFPYKQILAMLQEQIGWGQFLWCCTERGRYLPISEPSDLVEWEIELPLSQVKLVSVPVWEDLIWSRGDDWDSLFPKGLSESEAVDKDIHALVRFPLPANCLTCHGQLPPRYLIGSKSNPAYRKYLKSVGRNPFDPRE